MAKRKRARKAKGRREPYPLSSEDSALLERLLDHPARIALRAARSLEKPGSPFQTSPFLQRITERTLWLLLGGPDPDGDFPDPGEDRGEGSESPCGLILP